MSMHTTPEAILSYPSLFEPRAFSEGDTPKYEATFVFTEDTDLSELREAVRKVGIAKWGEKKFLEMLKAGKVRRPFRTDGEGKGYPEGSTFFAARNEDRPTVVSVFPSEHDPSKPAKITDPKKLYAGAIVKGLVTCFAYTKPQPGITFGLEGVQKIRDGERLDGRVDPQSVFQVDENAFASLDSALDEQEKTEAESTEATESTEADDIMAILGG